MTFGRDSEIGDKYFGSMGDAVINLIMRLIFSDQAWQAEPASAETCIKGQASVRPFLRVGSAGTITLFDRCERTIRRQCSKVEMKCWRSCNTTSPYKQ